MKSNIPLLLILLIASCGIKNISGRTIQNSYQIASDSELMLDGRIWKSKNLDIEIPDSYCQEDNSVYCSRYGRLYTWEAALIGCEQLGEGWRLPTNEEWQNLTRQYGGFFNDSEDKGYSAYLNLIEGGRAGFNAVLGVALGSFGSYRFTAEKIN